MLKNGEIHPAVNGDQAQNTAIGYQAPFSNTAGSNTATGCEGLFHNIQAALTPSAGFLGFLPLFAADLDKVTAPIEIKERGAKVVTND